MPKSIAPRKLALVVAFLFPGFLQIIRGKMRLWPCLVFLVGVGSLINAGTALVLTERYNVGAFDPVSPISHFAVFASAFPGSASEAAPTPNSLTLIAEVTPTTISFDRLHSIQAPEDILLLQPHFWTYLVLYILLYLACGALSAWDWLRHFRSNH